MRATIGWAADAATGECHRTELPRRELRDDDVAVRVEYCGVCHSDLHALRAWCDDPSGLLVPGHELTGVVTAAGPSVATFAVGDRVAVGNIVDSCGECAMCRRGQENFCRQSPTQTYGGVDRADGTPTLGGYSRELVVSERFAYHLPSGMDAAAAAPLMCAGVTVWEPLRASGVDSRTSVAVVGMGGLGHVAVKLAAALGASTTVIGRSPAKAADARRLGASAYLDSTDEAEMAAARDTFDVVLDTIPVDHDIADYLRVTALDGTLCQIGYFGPIQVNGLDLLIGRKKLTSAGSGGRPATAEMLNFCAEHQIGADVEVLPSTRVNEALERLGNNDVRYRFVLDMSDLDE